MFVRALRLAGFKSFAQPTLLEFERGVNVLVGPNGSGKSNLADALSWVLGSQAPSSLRGASMEDVIFAGSSERPRLGTAEVELIFDNSSRILPLDLNEVTISRSTDRSGATEYRINGAACRLLDIMELLSDSGVGRSLHTVVSQGELDQVLQARPEDRRTFIEEAAQIGKFRRRKDRALRKIERVDDNLLRLNDVAIELGRAIRPLKRQAKAASQFSELMSEHQDLKRRLTAGELQRLAKQGSAVDPEQEAKRAHLLEDELASVRALLDSSAREREALERRAERAQRTAHGLARTVGRVCRLARAARAGAPLLDSRLAAETAEGYRERIRLLEADRLRWASEQTRLDGLAEAGEIAAAEAGEATEVTKSALERAEAQLVQGRRTMSESAESVVRAEGAATAGRARVGSLEARVDAATERRDVAQRDARGASHEVGKAKAEVEALEGELDKATEAAARAEAMLEEARDHAKTLRAHLGRSESTVAAAEARVTAFEEAIALLEDLPAASERLWPLIEAARGGAEVARTAVVGDKDVLRAAEVVIEQRWQDVARQDEDLRRLEALVAGAGERLSSARRRREASEVMVATLDEELARGRDELASAEQDTVDLRASLPGLQASLEGARSDLDRAEREAGEARAAAEAAARTARETEVEARGARERALGARLRVEEAVSGIADAQAALAGLEGRRNSLRAARERVEELSEIAEYAASRAAGWATEADENSTHAREAARTAETRLSSLRTRERDLEERSSEVARQRSEAEIQRAEVRARSQAIAERAMEEWGLAPDDLMNIEPIPAESEDEARQQVEKLDRQMRRLGPVNPRAAEEFAELAERETFLKEQMEDLKESRKDLMRIVREVDDTIVEVFAKAFEDVAGQFQGVFERLFPGGKGSLKLTNPEDLLNTGIEIEAQPPGKNVRKLSLLSGGERSLVALAFLFSIFRARPSPFYLLDEVEAALDDINLSRFLGLISELQTHAQVLVVTHQKRTMEAADVLYGVSMAKDGVSKVIAKKMADVSL